MDAVKQQRVEEFGRRPFTVLVVDEAARAGGAAFDEAARVVERIPLASLHALYLMKRGTKLGEMQEIAASLRADTTGRAAALNVNDRLMAIHVRAGDVVQETTQLADELGTDLVIVGGHERLHLGGLTRRSIIDRLHVELHCPIVVALPPIAASPEIEPACPSCAMVRAQTRGASLWCSVHERHHHAAHTYSYSREHQLAGHDSSFIPTGISFS